jgi:SAM-dependent methyltransferase
MERGHGVAACRKELRSPARAARIGTSSATGRARERASFTSCQPDQPHTASRQLRSATRPGAESRSTEGISVSKSAVALLPADVLVKTSELDQAAWAYRPGPLGYVQRKRFALAAQLLATRRGFGDLLEVGYGSGIFLPELARRCERLHGVDVHDHVDDVTELLRRNGIRADLATAPAEFLPYPDASFDAVVAVSTLEFVDDVEQACREITRVLRPRGIGVFVTPGYGRVLDLGLLALTGEYAEETFRQRRQLVLPALRRHLSVARELRFPRVPAGWLYTAVLGGPPPAREPGRG